MSVANPVIFPLLPDADSTTSQKSLGMISRSRSSLGHREVHALHFAGDQVMVNEAGMRSGKYRLSTTMTPAPVLSPAELARKCSAKLLEKFDPARTRHKPLSIHRVEGRRFLEQFLDTECPFYPRPDRDKLITELLTTMPGFSLLEELFREEAIREILILAPNQIIARKQENWLPTSTFFRDLDQVRSLLERYQETGSKMAEPTSGGFVVKLSNGFRLQAITPPAVMGQPPVSLWTRETTNDSSVVPLTAIPRELPTSSTSATGLNRTQTSNSRVGMESGAAVDPFAKLRQRITMWIVNRCAAAGVYDLAQIPTGDLHQVIAAQLLEIISREKLPIDETTRERLTLEILASMNR